MRPKYEIGEVVLLRIHLYPELDGEYTVNSVLAPGQPHESTGGR